MIGSLGLEAPARMSAALESLEGHAQPGLGSLVVRVESQDIPEGFGRMHVVALGKGARRRLMKPAHLLLHSLATRWRGVMLRLVVACDPSRRA